MKAAQRSSPTCTCPSATRGWGPEPGRHSESQGEALRGSGGRGRAGEEAGPGARPRQWAAGRHGAGPAEGRGAGSRGGPARAPRKAPRGAGRTGRPGVPHIPLGRRRGEWTRGAQVGRGPMRAAETGDRPGDGLGRRRGSRRRGPPGRPDPVGGRPEPAPPRAPSGGRLGPGAPGGGGRAERGPRRAPQTRAGPETPAGTAPRGPGAVVSVG